MKRVIVAGVVCFLIGGLAGYFVNSLFRQNEVPVADKPVVTAAPTEQPVTDEQEDRKLAEQNSISRIDYPLVDLYFKSEKTYKLELVEYSGKKCKEYSAKGDFFQFNKENFSILTCPSGLGTTPPFILSVYEGKKRVKAIDCLEVRPGVMDGKW